MRKYYLFIFILTVVIGGICMWGIVHTGNPFEERALTNDSTRLMNLNSIKYEVERYVSINGHLPASQKDTNFTYFDPVSKKPYEYSQVSDKTYKLCAVFETSAQIAKSNKVQNPALLPPDIQPHKKGHDCLPYRLSQNVALLVSPTPTPPPPPRLVGYWKLDLLNPGYGVFDEVSQENDGIISNVKEVDGKVGKAGYFKGTSDSYIAVTQNHNIASMSGDFTLSLWTNRYDTGSRAIASTTNGSDGGFGIYVGDRGEVYCRTSPGQGIYNDSYSGYSYGNRLLPNTGWHYLAIVKSGHLCSVYIDGVDETAVHSQHTSILPNENWFVLGGQPNRMDQMYSGLIDEVRLYNYARTKDQILEDMSSVSSQ